MPSLRSQLVQERKRVKDIFETAKNPTVTSKPIEKAGNDETEERKAFKAALRAIDNSPAYDQLDRDIGTRSFLVDFPHSILITATGDHLVRPNCTPATRCSDRLKRSLLGRQIPQTSRELQDNIGKVVIVRCQLVGRLGATNTRPRAGKEKRMKIEISQDYSISLLSKKVVGKVAAWALPHDPNSPIPFTCKTTHFRDIALVNLKQDIPWTWRAIVPTLRSETGDLNGPVPTSIIGAGVAVTNKELKDEILERYPETITLKELKAAYKAMYLERITISVGDSSTYISRGPDPDEARRVDERGGEIVYAIAAVAGFSGGLVRRGDKDVGIHRPTVDMRDGGFTSTSLNSGLPFDSVELKAFLSRELLDRERLPTPSIREVY